MAAKTRYRVIWRMTSGLPTLFFLLLTTAAVYSFLQSSFFNLEHIVVIGTRQLNPKEITRLAAIPPATNLWRIDEQQVARNIRTHPMIAQVEVRRSFPRTLRLRVAEREAAVLLATGQGFVEMDASGAALRYLKEISRVDLPVITGTKLHQEPVPGDQVAAVNLDVGLKVVSSLPADLKIRVKELDVSIPEKIRMFIDEGLEVRLGDAEHTDQKFQVVTDLLQAKVRFVGGYIDVSYPERPIISYPK